MKKNKIIEYHIQGRAITCGVPKLLDDLQLTDIDSLTIITYFLIGTNDEDYCFAYYKEYPSICTQGKTIEEAIKKLREYITAYINKLDKSKFNNIMLDIETLGTESNSVILSIGAAFFNIETGDIGETFHRHIGIKDSIQNGLNMNTDTILWWLKQSKESQEKLVEGQQVGYSLESSLQEFTKFCWSGPMYPSTGSVSSCQIWGNSARFDCGLLQNAYNKLGMAIPWDFRKERCLRTLVSFAPDVAKDWVRTGTAHDALDDCRNQIGYCCEIWKTLKNNPK